MKNPNTPLRTAYVTGLRTATGLNVWGKKVPLTVKPIPSQYIVISSQSKQRFVVSKCGFEWMCQVTVDINLVNALGFANTEVLDAIEEKVLNFVQSITVTGFKVKTTRLVNQTQLDAETSTQSIERTILVYEHWLNNVT